MNRLKVKVCGMRDAGNIREVTRLPLDMMGFMIGCSVLQHKQGCEGTHSSNVFRPQPHMMGKKRGRN